MPIVAADMIVYGSANMPDDDSGVNVGGAIDTSVRLVFTDISPAGTVEVNSNNAGDVTQNVTITGLDASGVLVSEVLGPLTGTTYVTGSQIFERIMKMEVDAAHVGTLGLRETGPGDTLISAEPGVNEVRRLFYNAAADETGGDERRYYEKVFMKNTHATLALTSAVISEVSDPLAVVNFAVESVLNGTDTNGATNNRLVAPAAYTFDNAAKAVANSGNHTPSAGQGVWLELVLPAGTSPAKSTWTFKESGQTI